MVTIVLHTGARPLSFIKSILSAVLSVFAPVLLVFAGAGITSLGLNYDYDIVTWTGLIVIGAGILWGIGIFLYYGGAD